MWIECAAGEPSQGSRCTSKGPLSRVASLPRLLPQEEAVSQGAQLGIALGIGAAIGVAIDQVGVGIAVAVALWAALSTRSRT